MRSALRRSGVAHAVTALLAAAAFGLPAGAAPGGPRTAFQRPLPHLTFATSPNYLFAANGTSVSIYNPSDPTTPIGTITSGVAAPTSLAVGPTGDLYVGNAGTYPNYIPSVTEYAPPYTGKPIATYSYKDGIQSAPGPIAVGADGQLYVSAYSIAYQYYGTVVVYPPHSNAPSRTIVLPQYYEITSLALDAANNLYVGFVRPQQDGPSGIYEFAPGSNTGSLLPLQIYGPTSLAFDRKGNLLLSAQRAIEIFAPGSTTPRVIDNGFGGPAFVLDQTETHLYVVDGGDTGFLGSGPYYTKLFVLSYPGGKTLHTDFGVGPLYGPAINPPAPK